MKKRQLLFLVYILLLCGCGGNNKTSPSSSLKSSVSSQSSSISSSIMTTTNSTTSLNGSIDSILDTPSLKIDEISGVVTWDFINNAIHYNYIINDSEIQTTTSNTLTLKDKSNVSVQAANNITTSKWSNALTYYDTSDVIVEEKQTVNVYFHNANLQSLTIDLGQTINEPSAPSKNNYTFDNWYKDPFYQEIYNFNEPLYESTIIYANYLPNELIKDTYFWIKASPKMSSSIMSSQLESEWRFIPLKLNNNSNYKEFMATVTISGASSSSPCYFIVMDGFDDNSGRTYWKNNNEDFAITVNGTYNIYFSLETQYKIGNNVVHAKYELANNTSTQSINLANKTKIKTPVVSIDYDNNIARWEAINGVSDYEVIINNEMPSIINTNYTAISKGSHISVRAISSSGDTSNWSIPQANVNFIVKEEYPTHVYVYFAESNIDAIKVEYNSYIDEKVLEDKDDWKFMGWYLDAGLTNKVAFPYQVNKNTILYPKWEYKVSDYITKEYYKLVDSNNQKISGLTWNIDNYSFYEYESESITLEVGKTYYVKTLDDSKSWGPYSVETTGTYKIYFSEDYLWNIDTDKESNIYIAQQEISIYFTNAKWWSGTIYAYAFNKASGKWMEPWPGNKMSYVRTNSYGQDIYTINIDTTAYDYIIFSNGSEQTIDISLAEAYSGIGYYTSDEKDGSKYKVGTFKFS